MRVVTRQRRPKFSLLIDPKAETQARKVTLPRDLDDWLVRFAARQKLPSEVQAIVQILYERKNADVTA